MTRTTNTGTVTLTEAQQARLGWQALRLIVVAVGFGAWLATTAGQVAALAKLGGASWAWVLPVALASATAAHLVAVINPASSRTAQVYASFVGAVLVLFGASAGVVHLLVADAVAAAPAGAVAQGLHTAVKFGPVVLPLTFSVLWGYVTGRLGSDDDAAGGAA